MPDLRFRFVNVVDLMALLPEGDHPHGYTDSQFDDLFTADRHVVFAFHGYPRAVHQLVHGRSNPGRFHVRGFAEQGTTTTPFDMVVLNRMSRFHLAKEVLRRSTARPARLAGPAWPCAMRGWPSTRPTSASTSPTCRTSAPGRGPGWTGELARLHPNAGCRRPGGQRAFPLARRRFGLRGLANAQAGYLTSPHALGIIQVCSFNGEWLFNRRVGSAPSLLSSLS